MEIGEAIATIGVDPRSAPNEAWREVKRCASFHASRWRDIGDADDLVQDAMIAVLTLAERGDLGDVGSANALVRTAVKFARTNMWKKWRKRVEFSDALDEQAAEGDDLSVVEVNQALSRLEQFFAIIEADVDAFEATSKAQRSGRPGDRVKRAAIRRERMRAALLRSLDYSFDEIRATLGVDMSLQNLANRIALGRPLLIEALDRLSFPGIDPAAVDVMRALLTGPGRGHGRVGGTKPRSQEFRDAQAERIRDVWRKRKSVIAEAA